MTVPSGVTRAVKGKGVKSFSFVDFKLSKLPARPILTFGGIVLEGDKSETKGGSRLEEQADDDEHRHAADNVGMILDDELVRENGRILGGPGAPLQCHRSWWR